MTTEERVAIEVSDIAGFEFECPRCNARLFVPLDKYEDLRTACMNCREPWLKEIGGPNYTAVHNLLGSLRLVSERTPEIPVKIRLQLKERSIGR